MVFSEEPHSVITERDLEVRPLGGDKRRPSARPARARAPPAPPAPPALGALWRVAAAEAAASALLVALTCLAGDCEARAGGERGPAARALAGGLAVAALVQCFDHVSGAHMNPAVTLAAALAGRVGALRAAALAAAQLGGGCAGAALLLLLAPGAVGRCVTRPARCISQYQALAVEALLAGCLALANLSAWDVRNHHLKDSWPLRIGFTVVAFSLIGGDLTGASMNPMRSFAPALLSGDFESLWVYWAGPLSGAAAAAALYTGVWRAPAGPPAPAAAPAAALAGAVSPGSV